MHPNACYLCNLSAQCLTPKIASYKVSYVACCNPTDAAQATWCVADAAADPAAIQGSLDWLCSTFPQYCAEVQPGAVCYEPNTLVSHASWPFNRYYQDHAAGGVGSCLFTGSGKLVTVDPSFGGCSYGPGENCQLTVVVWLTCTFGCPVLT